jgi:alpha/beta superfamily hydrolase
MEWQKLLDLQKRVIPTMSTEMIPLFVGSERRLFASYHVSQVDTRQNRGVLLCNPFGQEALRAHRLYRSLAERLARSGIDVMRFDYYGTGDSLGNDEEGELLGWSEDIHTAHDELIRRSSVREVCWVGIRLGATLALRSAATVSELTQLILIDPIIDGPAYSYRLRQDHVERLESVFRRPTPKWRQELEANPDAFANEASGFGLAPNFYAQLAQITPALAPIPGTPPTTVLFNEQDPAIFAWQARCPADAAIDWVPLAHGYDWSAHEAIDGMLLPDKVLRELIQRLTK